MVRINGKCGTSVAIAVSQTLLLGPGSRLITSML